MSKKFRKQKDFVWKLLNAIGVGGPLELRKEGGLKNDGWFLSFKTKKSVDASGEPIPWFTYSAIKFIESRLRKNMSIFEYGSGSSSLWFSKRISKVTSLEHHKGWYVEIKSKLPANCDIHFIEDFSGDKYSKYLSKLEQKFDIILIDGIDRVNCCLTAPENLTENGIIILDNSDRAEYKNGKEFLFESGFNEIFFMGNAPVVSIYSCTSLFYRENNIFNI